MSILDRLINTRRNRLKLRENIWESDRLQQWHHRENLKHRFSNGVEIEIKLTNPKKP